MTGGIGVGVAPRVALASYELYDPATGMWTLTDSVLTRRGGHTATLLQNGQVLVAGGSHDFGPGDRAELYDPATGVWTVTGRMGGKRYLHTATLLQNGQVLVAGGSHRSGDAFASAELYDPATGVWTSTGSMATARKYLTRRRCCRTGRCWWPAASQGPYHTLT